MQSWNSIRHTLAIIALCSSSAIAIPVITSGSGTITPDANGGFILDCPTGCTFTSNAAAPTQTTSLSGNISLNSNQYSLTGPISTPSSTIYNGASTTSGLISGNTVNTTLVSGETVGGLAGSNNGTITNSASTITVTGSPATVGGSTYVGGLVGSNSGTITNTGSIAPNAGTLVTNNLGSLSVSGSYTIGSIDTTSTITSYPATVGGTTNVGGLVGTNNGTIEIAGSSNFSGGTLIVNNAGNLSTSSYYVGGHAGSLTITSNGNIAILDGSHLNLAGVPIPSVQIGLNGPMLPTGNITSDVKAFSGWLNDNGLVTTSQIDSIGSLVSSGQNFVLFGSHHRILLDNGIGKDGLGVWATGDYARHDPSQTNAAIGELGLYKDLGDFRLGMGAGMNQAKQTLPVNGNGKLVSRYLVLEGDFQSNSASWIASTTLFLGSNKADVSRGYLVGTAPELSVGNPKGSSWAARIRGDWSNAISIFGMNVSPYLSYTHAESRLDAYTETGGTLPLYFSQQKQSSNEIRAGATAITKLSEQTNLRFPLELAYRKNDRATITGTTIGLPFSFNTAGSSQNWARTGVELDHRLSEQTILNGATLIASQGGDSSWLATVSLKHAF